MSREDEIRERVSKATKGPWTFDSWRIFDGDEVEIFNTENILEHGDVAFIAHAREDVPYLLAENERLRREIEELRDEIDFRDGVDEGSIDSAIAHDERVDRILLSSEKAKETT